MMKYILHEIKTAVIATVTLAVIVSGIYPVIVWGIAQGFFADKADGSLIVKDGKVVGSRLLSQGFTGAQYFHPRPSAAGAGYDGTGSGGSNLGPLSKGLVDMVGKRAAAYRTENGLPQGSMVPADAVTASASGLDPDISPENALIQAPRVAHARGMSLHDLSRKIAEHTSGRPWDILGEPRVNVLLLNLDLDKDKK